MTAIDMAAVRTALLSPNLYICRGIGNAAVPGQGSACTIGEINLVLTGNLSDAPHPCISDVIRLWVIRIQDATPVEIRNSAAWREAAIGIAASAGTLESEKARCVMLREWMWAALGDEAVLARIPASTHKTWNRMLNERTAAAAHAAAGAAANTAYTAAANAAVTAANAVAYGVVYGVADAAANAAVAAANVIGGVDGRRAYWARRDVPGLLTRLIEVR